MADGGLALSWLSDYVLLFLKSPTWITPIAQFVDEKCIIFDGACEENKLEYTLCHNEFKQLVDNLFVAHLLEVEITEEDFANFCNNGLQQNKGLHHLLVEQMLSVDDFLTFRAMMCKRNTDLYSEAMQRLEKVEACGGVPAGEATAEAAAALPSESPQYATDLYDSMVQALDDDDLDQRAGETLAREWRMYEDQLFQSGDEHLAAQAQEEAELEQAIALSLQAEEERLRQLALSEQQEATALEAAEVPPPQELPASSAAAEAPPRKVLPKVVKVKKLKASAQLPPVAPPPGSSAAAELERRQVQALQQRERAERVSAVAAPAASEQILASAEAAAAAPGAAPPERPAPPTEEERRQRAEHLRRTRELLVQKRNEQRQCAVGEYQAAGGAAQAAAADGVRMPPGASQAGRQMVDHLTGPSAGGAAVPAGDAAQYMRQALAVQLRQTLTTSVPGNVTSGALGRLEHMKQQP